MNAGAAVDEVVVRPRARPEPGAAPRRQPPYAVVLHNDPINGFDYVVGVLKRVFDYATPRAIWLTTKIHFTGRGSSGPGPWRSPS